MSNIKEINTDGIELKDGEYLLYVSDGVKYVALIITKEWSEEALGHAVKLAIAATKKHEQHN